MPENHFTPRLLIERSQQLRREMTDPERLLWNRLRYRQLGVKFRRQAPRSPFIADFACLNPKLIVELDGSQHLERQTEDRSRTDMLESKGFCVMRFWNHQVTTELDAVVE